MITKEITPIVPSEDLLIQQADLEEEMTKIGVERFRASVERAKQHGREDGTQYGKQLLDTLIDITVLGIEEFIADREAGKAGPKGAAYKNLKLFEGSYDVVAFIALRFILSGLSGRTSKATSTAGRIGRALSDEYRYREVRNQDRKFYQRLRDTADKRTAYHVKRKAVDKHIAAREMDLPERWSEKEIVHIGLLLIEIVCQYTGLVSQHTVVTGPNTTHTLITATAETKEFIAKSTALQEAMRPVYEPMIIPPIDWTSPWGGGYLTRRVRPLRLVKAFNRQYLQSLEAQDITDVCAAVNAIQKTAWAINPFILTVLEIGWEKDFSLGKIPSKYDAELPPKPFDIATNDQARLEWRTAAHAVFMENLAVASKRVSFLNGMETAKRYSLFPQIYFPYQLDFRGRIYAAPQLTPQGPDWMKALLHFSEGLPLDEEASHFLAIHVANTGAFDKIDKAPLGERVQWVYDNQADIIACAKEPFENRWWTEADSPYCFLAACREWAGWVEHGEGFVSHLPVALDGSCSGIQHFSMALADEIGGAAVNLVPSEKPADIYTLVMDRAVAKIKADAAGEGDNAPVAAQWLSSGLLSRGTFKRPTMTYGYGSGQFGFREQIEVDTLHPVYRAYKRGEGAWPFEDNGFKASLYLSGVTINAVEATVVKAAEAMRWLKKAAGVVSKEGLPVRWTTPDGFVIMQDYRESATDSIDTLLLGRRVRASVRRTLDSIDKRKQASGFPPNFVHGLDATHLRMTARRAYEDGILAVAFIHDSFGTHAANTGRFFMLLRETMVEMYEKGDVISNLHDELKGQLSAETLPLMPEPPARGTLDVTRVVDCDFAFA